MICVLLSDLLRIFLFVVRPDVVYNIVLEFNSSLLMPPPFLYLFSCGLFSVDQQCTVPRGSDLILCQKMSKCIINI